MIYCPYCNTQLSSEPEIPPLSKRRRIIYDAVSAAGPDGMPVDSIVSTIFSSSDMPRSAYGMVRVHICEINKVISQKGQRITGLPHGGYRLVSTGGTYGKET